MRPAKVPCSPLDPKSSTTIPLGHFHNIPQTVVPNISSRGLNLVTPFPTAST